MEPKSKIATCIRCGVYFSVRDPIAMRGSRCPHVLQCGHSICESCLISALQIEASVACTKCAKQSLQKQGMKNLSKEFPINLYILGQMVERTRSRVPQDSKITFIPPTGPSVSRSVSTVSVKVMGVQQPPCSECTEKPAEWSCENCPANYCSACFSKVHGAARSLKSHIRAPITIHTIPMCTTHHDQRKDFFCHQCNEIICPCCAISYHTGHPVVTRAQMNEEYMDKVLAAVMVASAVLEEITKSQKELQNYLPVEERLPGSGRECSFSSGDDELGMLEKAERAVARHFAFAHGMLQLQEAAVMEQLGRASSLTKDSTRKALSELAAAAERTRALLAEANRVATAGHLKWCDLRDLSQRLLDTRFECCRLSDVDLAQPRVRFHVDPDIFSLLSNHCHLEVVGGSQVKLEPLGEMGSTSIAPDRPTSISPHTAPSVNPSSEKLQDHQTDSATSAVSAISPGADNKTTVSSSKSPPFTPIATANIVATAAAAALAAGSRTVESSPVVSALGNNSVNSNHDSTRTTRNSSRRSSSSRQARKGRDNSGPQPRNAAFHNITPCISLKITDNSAPLKQCVESPISNLSLSPAVSLNASVPFTISHENPPPKPFVAVGKPEVVRVVHIKNPTSFYVHRDQDKPILDELQMFLDKCSEREHAPPSVVEIDQMFICKFLVDDRWYRVVVKSYSTMLNPPESRDAIVDVFYVDYGNSERIPLSRLRPLPSQLINVPPYALHCALFDVYPKEGGQWPEDANRAFCKMVNGAHVHMNVMSFKDDMYFIDLCAIPGMKHTNFPVSMRDAMVFMDLARLEDENSLNIRHASAHFDSEYLKEEPLSKNENFPVVLSHINSPSQFYAQRRGCHAEYLAKLLDDMSKFYSTNKEGMIYDPGVGMPCAAQFSLDNSWYRAQVLRIPRKSWVEVLYVDYGNKEEIPYTSIRKLPEMFMRIPPQAIECSLADVMPTKGNSWPKSVSDYFLSITKDKELRLLVNDVSKTCVKVVLYEEKESVDVCLNALLTREGYALCIGVGASIVDYFKVEAAVPEEANQFQTVQPSRRKFRRTLKSDPGGVGFLFEEGKNVAGAATDMLDASAGPLLSMPVNIVTVTSPGCLYVSPCSNEEEIANLIADMQEFYSDMPVIEALLKENEKCCAWSDKNKKWYRAVIVEIIEKKAKVFYKDIAATETVPFDNLRPLDERFTNIHDGAFRCHMVGIHPAGGQNKWSSVACEMFSDLVNKTYSELFITKKGDIEDNSLPVELWARVTISPGPLEPNRVEWISLNRALVDKGMAIPTTMPETQEIIQHGTQLYKGESSSEFVKCNNKDDADNDEGADDNDKVKSNSVECSDSSDDENVYRHELILCPENPKSRWLDPPLLKKKRFVGITTYVDSQGLIFLHDDEDSETLALIRDALNKCLKDSQPKPQDMYWFPGQMCLTQFYADNCWYRGKIIKEIDDNKYEVLFVDYGNVEMCSVDMLRKDVLMIHIPVLCHTFQLYDILPASCDGKWNMDHLDFLHVTLDGKRCSVIVRSSLDEPCPSISLILPGKVDVAQLLVSLHYAIYSSNILIDSASNAESSDSVIIENVEETIEMNSEDTDMKTDADMKLEMQMKENLGNDTLSNNVNKLELSEDRTTNGKASSEQDRCELQTTLEMEFKNSASAKTEKFNSSLLLEDGGGDFQRKSESTVNYGGSCSVISEFGNVVRDNVNEHELGLSECISSIECEDEIDFDDASSLVVDAVMQIDHEQVYSAPECGFEVYKANLDTEQSRAVNREKTSRVTSKSPTNAEEENCILWSEEVEELGESTESSEEERVYKLLDLKENDTLVVEVTIVMEDPTQIVMVPFEDEANKIDCMVDFNLITVEMQDEAAYRPKMTKPKAGQPCCALYFDDLQWYRGTILQVNEENSKVKVEFVDYGNVEWIDMNGIHTIKPSWMTIPVQGIKCHLWNLKTAEDCERRMLVKVLTKLMFNSPLIAKIRERNPLAVELYHRDTESLVYQPLLDTGLLEEIM